MPTNGVPPAGPTSTLAPAIGAPLSAAIAWMRTAPWTGEQPATPWKAAPAKPVAGTGGAKASCTVWVKATLCEQRVTLALSVPAGGPPAGGATSVR